MSIRTGPLGASKDLEVAEENNVLIPVNLVSFQL